MPKGQKPKPKIIKELEGNRRKVGRAKILDEPRGIGRPRPALYLSAEERRLWALAVGSLPVGLLTRADEGALERYAIAWARFIAATTKIAATGLMVQSPMGPVRNPLLVVQNVAAKEMHAAGSELGLTPVARARMAAPTMPPDDPMALLLGMEEDEQSGVYPPTTRTPQ